MCKTSFTAPGIDKRLFSSRLKAIGNFPIISYEIMYVNLGGKAEEGHRRDVSWRDALILLFPRKMKGGWRGESKISAKIAWLSISWRWASPKIPIHGTLRLFYHGYTFSGAAASFMKRMECVQVILSAV